MRLYGFAPDSGNASVEWWTLNPSSTAGSGTAKMPKAPVENTG